MRLGRLPQIQVIKKVGVEKFRLWEHLYFYLNLAGLFPASDKVSSLRVEGEVLKAHTSSARMVKISFNNLIIFDENELYGKLFKKA